MFKKVLAIVTATAIAIGGCSLPEAVKCMHKDGSESVAAIGDGDSGYYRIYVVTDEENPQ